MGIISYDEVFQLLTQEECVPLMAATLISLEKGNSQQTLRSVVKMPGGNYLGLMPGYLDEYFMGAKVISVFHENTAQGRPSHQGVVLLFCAQTGELLAVLDGNAITEIRTGAVSAVATNLLANPTASRLALIGAGSQARSHLLAIQVVRPLTEVTVYDLNPTFAANFANWARSHVSASITVAESLQAAVAEAEIICTLTPAQQPILALADVRPGVHVNAVGSSTPYSRELATDLVQQARFFGDRRESVMNEAGDFLIPLGEQAITAEHFLGEIGQLLVGTVSGRTSPADITIFESLGLAVEDLAAARHIYEKITGLRIASALLTANRKKILNQSEE